MRKLLEHFILIILFTLSSTAENESVVDVDTNLPQEKIQIRVISQLNNYPTDWSNAYADSVTEFHYFSKAMEKCLKEIEGNYQFELKRFPAKFDEGLFGVSIYLHEWKSSHGGFIRAYFSARFEYLGEKGKIGSFAGDSFQVVSSMRILQELSFEKAVIDAGEKFVKKLQPILDEHFTREDLGDGN